MKKAEIIGDSNGNIDNNLEKPNYLSSVIQSYATSVLTPSTSRIENNMTFDLEQISK